MRLPTSSNGNSLRRRIFGVALATLVLSGVGAAGRPAALPAQAPNSTSSGAANDAAKGGAGADEAKTAARVPDTVGAEAALATALPPAAAGEAASPAEAEAPRPKVITYTVVEGDTIEAIAQRYGVSTETLLYVNDMYADDILQIGQELKIPTMDALVYEVVPGDTMWGIADAFDADFEEIVAANPDVDADALKPGDIVFVPGGTPPSRRTMVASRGGSRTPSVPGRFDIWPAWGRGTTDEFGWRTHPVTGVWHLHDGLDIDVDYGTPVAAVAAGTVTYADWLGGYGIAVKIDHGNGIMTMYAHLSQVAVSPGEWVNEGDLIGYSGSTGNSTGPHLHFTVLVDGEPVDPRGWLP
ncbi:MAG: M23 family metallopeptidase [Symbiobacterium sp.]|uniref:peptidoglycan DD-metalloendopeptidase family protein n=1 Tax=Symbiobacterium sp. TaxID=1971213 RepID=UPI003464DB2F